ncbi:hypothetical protein KEJ48_01245 [Candidatus Bathyarchaeota archaeon]|nr:hypothetical protein [Candidatus Bathyarchaeota archaeon]MBS7617557.1 hypothetical protein [Candidatus Bathyarchaeota archaeon]
MINGHGGGTERWIPQVIDRINWTKKSLVWPDWSIPVDAQVYGFCYISTKYAPSDLVNWRRQFIIDGYYPPAVKGEEDGISGDPTLSSKELGEKIFELAVSKISEFVKEVKGKSKRS